MLFFVTVAGLSKAQGHLAEPIDPGGGGGGLDIASLVSQHSGLVTAKDAVGVGTFVDHSCGSDRLCWQIKGARSAFLPLVTCTSL
jgi:hypothetical protein